MPWRKAPIVLFGTGTAGRRARSCLRHRYRIVAFADNDASKHGTTFLGRPVVAPAALSSFPAARIHIASMHVDAIYRQLTVDLGIEPARVTVVRRAILEGAYTVSPWTYAILGVAGVLAFTTLCGLVYALAATAR